MVSKQSPRILFNNPALSEVISRQAQTIMDEIKHIDSKTLLNTSTDDWCDYFFDRYKMEIPELLEGNIQVGQHEAEIDVSRDQMRAIYDRSRPVYITGTSVIFVIPFNGDGELFFSKPSQYTYSPPYGAVNGNNLYLTYSSPEPDSDRIRSSFDQDLAKIKTYLGWVDKDVSEFNSIIRPSVKTEIENRKAKLLRDQGLVASLGFPMVRDSNAPTTYVVPTPRKKPPVSRPTAGTAPFKAEPELEMAEYEHILEIVSNMSMVLERSPKTFEKMQEEDIRQHFLVQLNAQYPGQATGETFNLNGKTDIYINVDGKTLFIAECKFWKGSEHFNETNEQLLDRYTTWRDTKVAVIIFNRQKDFSVALSKIPDAIKAFKYYKRDLEYPSETGFRFVAHHKDDVNREIIVTVLVFEVPA